MPTIDELLDEVYGPAEAAPTPPPKIAAQAPAAAAPQSAPAPQGGEQPGAMWPPGQFFSNYVGGPVQDYLVNAIQSASGPGLKRDISQYVTKMAVPDTTTGALLSGATLIAPAPKVAEAFGSAARGAPKVLPAVKRMLYPILGGAAGGALEKGSPTDAMVGAGLGALTGMPAEVMSGVSKWYAGSKLAQRFQKEDPETLGTVVRDLVPEFGKLQTPKDFGEKVWQGVAQNRLSEVYDKRMAQVADRVKAAAPAGTQIKAATFLQPDQPIIGPGGTISSPNIVRLQQQGVLGNNIKYTVDDLMQDVRDLRFKGRTPKGDPKLTLDARQARDYATELSTDLAEAIRNSKVIPNGKQIANYYEKTDRKYARGAEMLRYLKQDGIVNEDGQLDMRLLQDQMKVERAYGLSHAFEPEEFRQLMDAVFRGGDATVVDKILKQGPHVGAHISESGRVGLWGNLLGMFKNNQYAGNYDVGFLKPKAPAVALQRAGAPLLGNLKAPIGNPISLGKPQDDSE